MPTYDDAYMANLAAQQAEGLDPHSSDDTVLGVAFVYCDQHMRAHTTGWCTVALASKYRLSATTEPEATAEARSKGFRIYSDPVPCRHCGVLIDINRREVGAPYGEGARCQSAPRRGHEPVR